MSQIPPTLNLSIDDVRKMLTCEVHIGTENVSPTMKRYVWKRNGESGIHIIDIRKTWEKLQLAARVIVAMENSYDVCAVALTSTKSFTAGAAKQEPFAQRAVLKFSQHVKCRHIAGRYTPGTFTNRKQAHFFEPRLLVVSDPIKDFQPILESSYVNMPVIAMADVDAPTRHIDIVIPCNTKSPYSVALMWWMLAREVLRLKGEIKREGDWEILIDMFLYIAPKEEREKEESKGDEYTMSVYEVPDRDRDEGDYDVYDQNKSTTEEKVVPPGEPVEQPGEPGTKRNTWQDDEEEWGDNEKPDGWD